MVYYFRNKIKCIDSAEKILIVHISSFVIPQNAFYANCTCILKVTWFIGLILMLKLLIID